MKQKVRGSKRSRGFKRPESSERKFYTKDGIFISRMASILQMPKGRVKAHFSQRTISVIRLNNLAAKPEQIEVRLKSQGLVMEPVEWAPLTYIVKNRDKSELGKMPEYDKGLFYIQNLSSMLPVLVLNPTPYEKVLDLCAAPGSKTSHIASLMLNRGEIMANDDNFGRIQKLREVLYLLNVKNCNINVSDGRSVGAAFSEQFDKVLLDAPCSGEGLVYLNGPKPLRFWNLKKIKIMVKLQEELILSAFDALKPGGQMVYSTCTLEPDENEGIVSHLLSVRPDASVEKIEIVDSPRFADYKAYTTDGIIKWSGNKYNSEAKKCLRIIPGSKMQGFFVCLLKKAK